MNNLKFIAPSGTSYTIREQNGEDEEILSNQADAKDLMNLTKFISAIVIDTDFNESGHLLVDDVLKLPLLDRYVILFKSRIFSLGNMLSFEYDWGNNQKISYEQDLQDFLFNDYSKEPSKEELEEKVDAIPYYPYHDKDLIKSTDGNELKLTSGKILKWSYLNGNSEIFLMDLPANKRTRNSDLLARNLRLLVDGKFEKVTNFKDFSIKEMAEMRKAIVSQDPIFMGTTTIENPNTGASFQYPIMASPGFFFLTEV